MSNIISLIRRLFNPSATELSEIENSINTRFPKRQRMQLERELRELYDDAPRIAIIGKTGVGKSSTINALFNPYPPFRVGHVVATTKKIREKRVSLGRDRGSIVVIDYPGLNESIEADEKVIPLYNELLAQCDVALWILKADDRALSEDQRLIRTILTHNLKGRLVIGLNQIDLIQPGRWVEEYNVPSRQQEKSIEVKVKDIRKKLKNVDLDPQFIVPYSALRGYRLTHLFKAMIEVCPVERAWLLSARQEIAPYQVPSTLS